MKNDLNRDNIIVEHKAGSHAYGTSLPTSDEDVRGIFVASPEQIRTPFFPVREVTDESQEDTKFYELNHFMKLCLDCNPNIIETLWVDETDITFATPAYYHLRKHREVFLSKRIIYTTTGYAMAQLKRIRGHNKWLTQQQEGISTLREAYEAGKLTREWLYDNFDEAFLEFIKDTSKIIRGDFLLDTSEKGILKNSNVQLICKHRPRQTDFLSLVFNFTNEKIFKLEIERFFQGYRLIPFSGDMYGLYKADGYETYSATTHQLNTNYEGVIADHLGAPLLLIKFNKEEYKTALERYNQYWTWRKNRNVARHELEEKYGFDTKHAMHLVRLLRMGHEAVTTGQLIVKRPDAQELLDIRNGKWTYEQVITYAEEMEKKVFEEGKKSSVLRHSPDLHLAAKITMEVQDIVWRPL